MGSVRLNVANGAVDNHSTDVEKDKGWTEGDRRRGRHCDVEGGE